jgi:hypothetical protein
MREEAAGKVHPGEPGRVEVVGGFWFSFSLDEIHSHLCRTLEHRISQTLSLCLHWLVSLNSGLAPELNSN